MPICTARTAACVHARWHGGGGLSTEGAIYPSAGSARLRALLEQGRAGAGGAVETEVRETEVRERCHSAPSSSFIRTASARPSTHR